MNLDETENKDAKQNEAKETHEDDSEKNLLSLIGDTLDGKKPDTAEKKPEKDESKKSAGDDAIPPKPEDKPSEDKNADDNSGKKDEASSKDDKKPEENKDDKPKEQHDVENAGDEELATLFDSIDFDAIEKNDGMSLDDLKGLVTSCRKLRDELVQVKRFVENVQAEKAESEFDEIFDSLSDEFGDVLGRGKGRELEKVLQDNRNAVLKKASILMKAYTESGERKSIREVVKEGALLLFSENVTRKNAEPKKEVKQERRGAFIARGNAPTSGNAGDDDAEARALALIEQRLKS